MTGKYQAFMYEYIALCEKHGVVIQASMYDSLELHVLEPGENKPAIEDWTTMAWTNPLVRRT